MRNIIVNTPSDPKRSCAIANVGIANMKPSDLAKTLLDRYKVWTVAIDGANVHGVRVTPQLFTTPQELAAFDIYKPGLSIQQIRQQLGLKKIVKLASNECALGSSPKAVAAFRKSTDDLFRYPESRSVDLRAALAERHHRDLGEVIVGTG